jgi:hypothetical protein
VEGRKWVREGTCSALIKKKKGFVSESHVSNFAHVWVESREKCVCCVCVQTETERKKRFKVGAVAKQQHRSPR